jgi:hypothetical protein
MPILHWYYRRRPEHLEKTYSVFGRIKLTPIWKFTDIPILKDRYFADTNVISQNSKMTS